VAELSKAELNAMVAEAIVDAHDEYEQVSGFYNILEEELAVPFEHRQAIPILDLPLPAPSPPGSEWIAAYRHWAYVS
jgi:hypothetical protein